MIDIGHDSFARTAIIAVVFWGVYYIGLRLVHRTMRGQ